MAFNRHGYTNGATVTLTSVGYATPLNGSVVIGLSVANIHAATTISVDVSLYDGAADFYLVKNAPIAPGGALVVVGGDQKVVLKQGDLIKVKSNTASSIDVVLSVLEN